LVAPSVFKARTEVSPAMTPLEDTVVRRRPDDCKRQHEGSALAALLQMQIMHAKPLLRIGPDIFRPVTSLPRQRLKLLPRRGKMMN